MTEKQLATQEKAMVYTMDNGDEMKLTMSTVRKFLVQGNAEYVTDSEILYFMHECKARKLNPFLRQCWLIKYSRNDNAQIVEAIHHKRAKARKAPDCKGWKKGLIVKTKDGELKRSIGLLLEGETLLGAYFEATPEGWNVPYELEINLNGYIKRKRDGNITQFWQKEKQPSQIMKVVESQGLSALWGDTIGNTYIPEELPPAIDMTESGNGKYEVEPEPLDTSEFERQVKEIIDYPDATLDKFVGLNAEAKNLSIDAFKVLAGGHFEDFWPAFETWRKANCPGDDKKWICDRCGFKAQSDRGLKSHMTRQHSEPDDTPSGDENDQESSAGTADDDEKPLFDRDAPPLGDPPPEKKANGYIVCPKTNFRLNTEVCANGKCEDKEKCQPYQEYMF